MNNEILRVSSKSNPNLIAGAIAGQIKEHNRVELKTVGAGSVFRHLLK